MSLSSVFSIGGYMASSAMFKSLGNHKSFDIGICLSMAWNSLSAVMTQGWQFFGLIPLNSVRFSIDCC